MVSAEKLLESEVAEKYYSSEVDTLAFILSMNSKKKSAIELPRIHTKGRCTKKIITPSCQDYDIHVCPTLVADKNYGKCSYKRFLSTSHYPRPGVLEVWHTTDQLLIPYMEIIDKAVADTERQFQIINGSKDDIFVQFKRMGAGDYFRLRRLTPRECFRFMGAEEVDIDKLVKSGVPDDQLYKISGNAIVVKVLCNLYTSIFNDVSSWFK
jgi:site-specific DNA-cytosine methylase